jgi:hypothetical protein
MLFPPNIVLFMRQLEKIRYIRHATDENVIRRMRFECWITKARIKTHSQNMKQLLLLQGDNGYANAPQCYVSRNLPVLSMMYF